MTTNIIQLSKQVAEVLGVPAYAYASESAREQDFRDWLAEDAGRCAEIAADKMIGTKYYGIWAEASWWGVENFNVIKIKVADHNNERIKAYCVAVCKAVIEQSNHEH